MSRKKKIPQFTLVRSLTDEERGDRSKKKKGKKKAAARKVARTRTGSSGASAIAVTRVGIMDLGAWLSGLVNLMVRMNAAQKILQFFEVQAPIPAGLAKRDDYLAAWAEEKGGPLTPEQRSEITRNMIADTFFVAGETIRVHMGVDYLVGVTPAMVAGTESDGSIYWNHFSSYEGRVLVVSTADLREFAAKARRSFDAAVGSVLLAQLLVAMSPKLGFHDDTGCLFDYDADRTKLVEKLKSSTIEPECLAKIAPALGDSALAILATLKAMPR